MKPLLWSTVYLGEEPIISAVVSCSSAIKLKDSDRLKPSLWYISVDPGGPGADFTLTHPSINLWATYRAASVTD